MTGWARVMAAMLLLVLTLASARAENMEDEDDDDKSAAMPGGQPPAPALPGTPDRAAIPGGQPADESDSFGGPLWSRANLFGDPGGGRSVLAAHGLTFGLEEEAEVLGNLSGGTRRGAVFEGVLSMGVGVDTGKAGLWPGGIFNASAYQIHGRGLSLNNLGDNLNTASGLEALRGTLLFELWYQQTLPGGRVDMRVGQLAADQEFMLSTYGDLFINNAFGWPTLAGADLPSGGPAFPLATPGVRLRAKLLPDVTVLLGVYNGNPAGPGNALSQLRDSSGTAFRVNDGSLTIGELQYTVGGGEHSSLLPGTYKLGVWYDTARLQTVAETQTNTLYSLLRSQRGNWSIYGVADQLLFRPLAGDDEGVGAFIRVLGAPGDRNLVNVSADFGLTWKGIITSRQEDTAGIGVGVAHISNTTLQVGTSLRTLDSGAYQPSQSESVLELTYQAQFTPWWQVQPTAQYLFNLGAGAFNPRQPSKRLGDAAVLGLRTAITF